MASLAAYKYRGHLTVQPRLALAEKCLEAPLPASTLLSARCLLVFEKMTRKGLRSLFSHKASHGHRRRQRPSSAGSPDTCSSGEEVTKLEEQVAIAESIIVKWDSDSSDYAKVTSLFYEDRIEARRFLAQVGDLQRAMLAFASSVADPSHVSHTCLARAQTLMQAAMRRLEKEFYQILAANRDLLDPESVSLRSARSSVSEEPDFDPWEEPGSPGADALSAGAAIGELERTAAVATTDLRAIADAMIFAGYGKECVSIYRTLRKSIVDEGLFRLGFDRLASARVKKKDWAVLDLRTRSWIGAARVAVRTLFHGERVLVDHVFTGSDNVREVVFANVAAEAAVQFLAFPEAVSRSKRAPEKLFRILDMYGTLAEISPEIELVFSFDSTASVRSQALASLAKLADAARAALGDFELMILKESSRAPIPGGGVHPMTRNAISYIALLADHEPALEEIYADFPLQMPSIPNSALPAIFTSEVGKRIAWLVLTLILKLQKKAEAYHDAALSYLFLANNLQHIVNEAQSCGLGGMVGEEWVAQHAAKARQYAAGYERAAWARVAAVVPAGELTAEEAMERARAFGAALEEACAAQARWVVEDDGMREEVRATVRDMVVPAYRVFYTRWRSALGDATARASYSPDEVRERLGELFSQFSGSDGSDRGLGSQN